MDLEALMRELPSSRDLVAIKLAFANPAKQDYRLRLTPELGALVGPGDYLGAHPSVLAWASAGSPMRNRDAIQCR